EPTADGYTSSLFSYRVEASNDLRSWELPVMLIANPAQLPDAPAGYRYVTFRLQSPALGRTFFRTTVLERS
ncbi:MAG: hypothetical protein ACR2RV_02510, partial [Verrucomicrobiales bacterium]